MSDDFFLRNRSTIAIITGGTQGLGLAIARRLGMEGAQGVVLSGRRLDKGEKAAASIQSHGTNCIFVKADVSIPEDCDRLVATALERFGTVNGLVNAAALPAEARCWTPASSSGNVTSTPMRVAHFC
jgi:NAD(P)-dependent dehydrogenase (short-subunit alcohol dehydrogenase family)